MVRNLNIVWLVTFVALTFWSCDTEPKAFINSETQLIGKYRFTFEAIYDNLLHYDIDVTTGSSNLRNPRNTRYHSLNYNYAYYADNTSHPIDIRKFKLILKMNKTVEFSDYDNQEVSESNETIYRPRPGTWEYTGGNTFVIHLPQTPKTLSPDSPEFPKVDLYCQILSTGRENGNIYYHVKGRTGNDIPIVKEFRIIKDDNIVSELN